MQNLQEKLIEILKDDTTYYNNEKLLKNKLTEDALKLEPKLFKYILSDDKLKKHFFLEVDGVLVFDKDKFIQFVNDKKFLPDSYTSFKNKIGLLDENSDYFREKKDVVLVWPYKDCVLEGGQDKEDQKRDEIFYNEILAPDDIDRLFDPKVLTNFKKYDKDGEHSDPKDISRNDNLIIKGNNLLALHSLLKLYRGKVKLIYIDPPYNIGNGDSFNYNDKFNHSTWLTFMKNRLETAYELLSDNGVIYVQIDNTEIGHLKVLMDEVFKNNLISIISWQRASQRTVLGQGETPIIDITEYILVYAKTKNSNSLNNVRKPILVEKYDIDGKISDLLIKMTSQYNQLFVSEGKKELYKEIETDRGDKIKIFKHKNWQIEPLSKKGISDDADELYNLYIKNFDKISRFDHQQSESTVEQLILNNIDDENLFSTERTMKQGKRKGQKVTSFYLKGNVIYYLKKYAKIEGDNIYRLVDMNNFWTDTDFSSAGIANEGGVKLKRGKKPEALIKAIIELSTDEDDVIMDFFLGIGTTCAVAHKMGRKYIGIEQLDYGNNDSVTRLKNVINGDQTGISKTVAWQGGGSFVYCELKKWNQNYIDEIETAKTSEELLSIYDKMKSEAFFRYDVDLSKFDEKEFIELTLEQQKEVLIECLDKNHLYVNLSEMKDATYQNSDEDKEINRKFNGI